mgnify:CR=1 FL=1
MVAPIVAWVEKGGRQCFVRELIALAIAVADLLAQFTIECCRARVFDILVFVEGGDTLGGQLAAEPGVCFGEADIVALAGGANGRGAAT